MSQNKQAIHAVARFLTSIYHDVSELADMPCVNSELLDGLVKRIETRGLDIILISFPELGKLYDKGVSSGVLDISSIPKSIGGCTKRTFRSSWIFRYLLHYTFQSDGKRHINVDPKVIWGTRQALYAFKKVKIACDDSVTRNTVADFLEVDALLRRPSGSWNSDIWRPRVRTFALEGDRTTRDLIGILNKVKLWFTPSKEVDIWSLIPRHGPGAVADAKTGTDKFQFPHWPRKLNGVFPYSYFTAVNDEVICHRRVAKSEPPARLLAVPKTLKGPRLITAEPTAHQYIQQGVLRWLRDHLPQPARATIDFKSQLPSREAALAGSKDDLLATVDLSAASDRLSTWTIERMFGTNQSFLRCLHACRTRTVVDGTGTLPFKVNLRKFAGMGSAVTFPVQSLVYAALAVTATLYSTGYRSGLRLSKGRIMTACKNVRVFGDDIVVPSSAVPYLSVLLEHLQLKVNVGKTHVGGNFRESCGMDAYQGVDVTPVYISHLHLQRGTSGDAIASWVEVSNNFHLQGMWRTSSMMTNELGLIKRHLLVSNHRNDTGIRLSTFSSGSKVGSKIPVYDENLHIWRQKAFVLCARNKVRSRGSEDDLLEYFLQAPNPEIYWKHGYVYQKSSVLRKDWVRVDTRY